MAGEDDQLVEVLVARCVVRKRSDAELVCISLVFVSGIDEQHDVEKRGGGESDVDGEVASEVGVGEHVLPVDGRRQDDEAAGERRQMRGQALRLTMVCAWTNLCRTREGERVSREEWVRDAR